MKISSKFKIIVLMVLMILLIVASSSWGNVHTEHHKNGKHVSPFVQKQGISFHCILKGHKVNDLCPHLLKGSKDKNIPYVIGSSCGSHPFQKKSTTSGPSLKIINDSFFQMPHYEWCQALYLNNSILSFSNNDTVEPPPKLS